MAVAVDVAAVPAGVLLFNFARGVSARPGAARDARLGLVGCRVLLPLGFLSRCCRRTVRARRACGAARAARRRGRRPSSGATRRGGARRPRAAARLLRPRTASVPRGRRDAPRAAAGGPGARWVPVGARRPPGRGDGDRRDARRGSRARARRGVGDAPRGRERRARGRAARLARAHHRGRPRRAAADRARPARQRAAAPGRAADPARARRRAARAAAEDRAMAGGARRRGRRGDRRAARPWPRGVYPQSSSAHGSAARCGRRAAAAPIPVVVPTTASRATPEALEIDACTSAAWRRSRTRPSTPARRVGRRSGSTEDDGRVEFSIEDDGVGFDAGAVSAGAGLTNLADRVAAVGGTLRSTPRPARAPASSATSPRRLPSPPHANRDEAPPRACVIQSHRAAQTPRGRPAPALRTAALPVRAPFVFHGRGRPPVRGRRSLVTALAAATLVFSLRAGEVTPGSRPVSPWSAPAWSSGRGLAAAGASPTPGSLACPASRSSSSPLRRSSSASCAASASRAARRSRPSWACSASIC